MAWKKVLITVKTYPVISTKYKELVCTAGFDEEGNWIRIYPVPFRQIDYENQYSKYQWMEIDLIKNNSDPRPESYRPNWQSTPRLLNKIDTKNDWAERKKYALKEVYTNFEKLLDEAKSSTRKSLATFKPTEVLDFEITKGESQWGKQKLERLKQTSLSFEPWEKNIIEVVNKLPYNFHYLFKDETGKLRRLMIEDWEVGALYWNCLKRSGSESEALDKVKEMYFDTFVNKRDLHFYLGTQYTHHMRKAKNPFVIIGALPLPKPKKTNQMKLDF